MAVKLGDRIKARISYGMEGGTMLPREEGTVVYIHPEGRFYTLEFTFPGPRGVRKFRESYPMQPDGEPEPEPDPHGLRKYKQEALGRWLEYI